MIKYATQTIAAACPRERVWAVGMDSIVWTIYWGDYLFWGKDAATDVRLAKW